MNTIKLLFVILLFSSCLGQNSKKNIKMVDISKLDRVSEMLDENLFWKIIDYSKRAESQEETLISEILKLSPKEIVGFRLRTDKLLFDTYNSQMWCAGYIMNGGCSDDGFEYFRNWVISRGKEVFYKAKENPDSLISQVGNNDFYEFESFWYVALDAFKQKTGKELYDYIDYNKFKTSEGNYPQFKFDWSEERPETMKVICPNLYSKLWN